MTYSGLNLFGEVLYDCFPDGTRVLGGAPFNVAWHCQAFGLQPLFISRVGNDAMGQDIIAAMHSWGMNTSGLQLDPTYTTGTVDVSFTNGEPAYDIVENSAWDFIDSKTIPSIAGTSILYHGTLAARSTPSAESLKKLKQQSMHSVFVDVNLRPPWWQLAAISRLIQGCRWIKLNRDELSLLVPQIKDMEGQARSLLNQYRAELVVVTQGEAGAAMITHNDIHRVTPEKQESVVDTVGAGDAFCSVLLLGLYQQWSLRDTLERAQQFASAVVQIQGASTDDRTFYEPFTQAWGLA